MISRFVYVIGVESNPVKVGVADDPIARLMELQIGCPDKLTLWHAVAVNARVAGGLERAVHTALNPHHRHGEWFNVTADYALEAIMGVARYNQLQAKTAATDPKTMLKRAARHADVPAGVMRCVRQYKQWKSNPNKGPQTLAARAEGRVLKELEAKGLAVFKKAILKPLELEAYFQGLPDAMAKAEDALVKALIILCDVDAEHRSEMEAERVRYLARAC